MNEPRDADGPPETGDLVVDGATRHLADGDAGESAEPDGLDATADAGERVLDTLQARLRDLGS